MKVVDKICSFIATLGPIGYFPAPGTFGTLAAIPLLIGFRYALASFGIADNRLFLLVFLVVAWWIVDRGVRAFNGIEDPSEIVLDEVLGFFVTMSGLTLSPVLLLFGFLFFRFFDIYKPFGIDRVETLAGAWGIILDDVLAGILSHICLALLREVLWRGGF